MGKRKFMTVIGYLHKQLEENGIKVSKIILFGSQMKKTATNDSDIDVVIVSDDFRRKDLWKRTEMLKAPVVNTIEKYVVPLDVIPMTREELERKGSLIAGYARKGIVVFAA
jgi:uncharacterized protein